MKIKFDSNQQYQLDAVQAVVDVFDGQPLAQSQFEVRMNGSEGEYLTELGLGNRLSLSEGQLLANVQQVQHSQNLPQSEELVRLEAENAANCLNFSVEMETGTGKTYVYLRTLYELHRQYGFKKFIIVVPSVAIREGVQKSMELMAEHFRSLYNNPPVDSWVYDSKQVSRLRQFAGSNGLQVLIINIDAFNKKSNNVIHQPSDRMSGHKPIEFIQAARPIVVLDEPQNMESERSLEAIASLHPLVTLRYSATHRNLYNQLYRLDPVQAYDLKLVKRIEVASILDENDFNQPYIQVKSIKATKSKITARLEIDVQTKNGPKRKTVSISRSGTDLYEKSGERVNYQGYLVGEIDAMYGYVTFTNGVTLDEGATHGGRNDEIMRVQVYEAVKEHLEKERALHSKQPIGQRLKVLTLFFIDRVANYIYEDSSIRRWFIEAYGELGKSPRYEELSLPAVEHVHNGYFAKDRKGAKDTSGKTKADDDAYALIMRDKERLLSLDEPLRFIFSHSALREGWDNPNVFQICTLNESRSELRKRQEIGRGLRLPVMENGERCFDESVNRLTVIANESYADFARALQSEIEEECGVQFGNSRIKDRRQRKEVRLKKGWRLDPNFQELWERIKHKTRYSVAYTTDELIKKAAKEIAQMPAIKAPSIRAERAMIEMDVEHGVEAKIRATREATAPPYGAMQIPDLLGYLQRETELTRVTLAQILIRSGRLDEVVANPQQFLDQATRTIRDTLNLMIIDGIKYERIMNAEYEMLLFEEEEIESYLTNILNVDGSIYEGIVFDSETERQFAETLDQRTDIKLFIKLPNWLKIETPLGPYNPDWAIVKQPDGEDEKLYLVRETKGTHNQLQMRTGEWGKIQCGGAHFDIIDVDYKHVTSASEI